MSLNQRTYFRYNYDAGGNVTWSEETITSTRIITYAYDITSRLITSKVDVESTTWYYRFDNNGNLKEMTPNGASPANGALRYTYNGANQLNKVETHNGSAYSTLAQMAYDGIGNRVVLTGWVSGIAYTTTYASRITGKVQILQATSGANSTLYLYGLNQIGEFGLQSVYYLTDGAGSVRQLVDPNGAVKLARMYEPFGQVLMQTGVGDPIYGYLGAQFDRISGLLYINGAYYDPVTGRFLSPSSGGANPYVPLGGAALAPILILALIGRKKKGKVRTGWVVIALMMSATLTLVSCNMPDPQQDDDNNQEPTTEVTPNPNEAATPVPTPSATPVPPTATPLPSPTATCTPTPTSAPLPGDLPQRHFIAKDPDKPDEPKVKGYAETGWTCSPTALFIVLQDTGLETDWNTVITKVGRPDHSPEDGGLDDNWRNSSCPTNHVCTSLKVIEKVAKTYASNADAHENWEKEDIMRYIKQDIPVMVNYGGATLRSTGHSLVAYGYDLDVESERGGTFWFIDPSGGGTTSMTWERFKGMWAQSDYGDPTRRNPDGTDGSPYHNWALAIPQ